MGGVDIFMAAAAWGRKSTHMSVNWNGDGEPIRHCTGLKASEIPKQACKDESARLKSTSFEKTDLVEIKPG